MRVEAFNWDFSNEAKCKKHGLSIGDIENFFLGEPSFAVDIDHSQSEDRYVAFGLFGAKYVVCIFTFRVIEGRLKIRVISARYAKSKEIEVRNEKSKTSR